MGGYELIVLLEKPWHLARVNLYGSLFVNDATLLICPKHSSKDCGSLALNMGTSLMKCKFPLCEEDLVMLFDASVVCWCNHCVLWVNSVWCLKSWIADWLKSEKGLIGVLLVCMILWRYVIFVGSVNLGCIDFWLLWHFIVVCLLGWCPTCFRGRVCAICSEMCSIYQIS